ncbi:shikimate dehydrogenase [Candidatus Sumerlaeota bacterium]|nr:shikimate dehydrogenase [Candidatus Sumerlaeota bacterium]
MNRISGKTRLVGLFGWPVSHSLSPVMHNAALAAAGIDAAYVPLPVPPDRIADGVRGIRAANFVGCNVTIPHKIAVAGLMDQLTPQAQVIGAVNTIRVEADGSLTGHNTDCEGAVRAVESDGACVKGKTVAIIGAGGAGRGVAVGCALAGARRIILLNRTLEKATALIDGLRAKDQLPGTIEWEAVELSDHGRNSKVAWDEVDLAFQMTNVGMESSQGFPLDARLLSTQCHVLESIYAPRETPFLRECRAKGLQTSDGLSMLLEQGAASFQFWFGVKADRTVMRMALDNVA